MRGQRSSLTRVYRPRGTYSRSTLLQAHSSMYVHYHARGVSTSMACDRWITKYESSISISLWADSDIFRRWCQIDTINQSFLRLTSECVMACFIFEFAAYGIFSDTEVWRPQKSIHCRLEDLRFINEVVNGESSQVYCGLSYLMCRPSPSCLGRQIRIRCAELWSLKHIPQGAICSLGECHAVLHIRINRHDSCKTREGSYSADNFEL